MFRRTFLKNTSIALAMAGWPRLVLSQDNLLRRQIYLSGEEIPVIGMGTWQTFNVGSLKGLLKQRAEVLAMFFKNGGSFIDSSPMYGSSEEVLGQTLEMTGNKSKVFAATKVWTGSTEEGRRQVNDSERLWGLPMIHLQQVHNLLNLEEHLKTLFKLKEQKRIKYVGITTSHGRRHSDFAKAMREYPLDFVQFTYNISVRDAEEVLLPLAQERKQAVVINRPLGGGALIDRVQRHAYPEWAKEIGCNNWPEFLLKYIVSHPAVTCAIPATSQVVHMKENMGACRGRLPTEEERQKMANHVAKL